MPTRKPPPPTRPSGRFTVDPAVSELIAAAQARGVSMLKVCRAAGVHHDTFGRWRRGAGRPMLDTLRRLHEQVQKTAPEQKP